MTQRNKSKFQCQNDARLVIHSTALILTAIFFIAAPTWAQSAGEVIGQIEGQDVKVGGTRVSGSASVLSGNEIVVESGYARITLAVGGELDICGPARLTVHSSGGAITVALTQGRVHARISAVLPLVIYSAQMMATPVSVSGRARDVLIGMESDGTVCARGVGAAIRLEQQLTGTSLLVPQGSEVSIPNGELDALRPAVGSCWCDVLLTKDVTPKPAGIELRAPIQNPSPAAAMPASVEPPKSENATKPTVTAVMPPLSFEAKPSAPPAEPRPETVIMLSEVRVTPTVVFTGRVEGVESEKSATKGSAPVAPPTEVQKNPAEKKQESFGTKLKNFFRRLFGGKPKKS